MDSELQIFFMHSGLDPKHIAVLEDNEINGEIFAVLVESDFDKMFPAVGVARRVKMLQKSWIKQQEANGGSDSTWPVEDNRSESESLIRDGAHLFQRENTMIELSYSGNTNCEESMEMTTCTINPIESRPVATKRRRVPTLPVFSEHVSKLLKTGDAKFHLRKVIEECSYHIIANGDISDKGSYATFSKEMCAKYPCLQCSFVGRNDWSEFSKKLSQKLRNIRHIEKKKARLPQMPASSLNFADSSQLSIEEANKLLLEEYAKCDRCWDKVVLLFKHVHTDRRSKISALTSHSISQIMDEFGLLTDIKLIREEFLLLVKTTFEKMKKNYDKMLAALETLLHQNKPREQSEHKELELLVALQKNLRDNRIKKKIHVSAITKQQANQICLENKKKTPPHLVIFTHDPGDLQGWILADGRNIQCGNTEGIVGMLVDLMACYYAWQFQYPKDFNVLGFLQETVIGDLDNQFEKTSKFIDFQKQFIEAIGEHLNT